MDPLTIVFWGLVAIPVVMYIICFIAEKVEYLFDRSRTVAQENPQHSDQIPKNIYGAIETFAALGHAWKRRTHWPYESLDFAHINVRQTGENTMLKMQFRGDCLSVVMDKCYPEIYAESDNIVSYESSEVNSFDPSEPEALWNAFVRGCPNAVLERVQRDKTGTWVFIRFEE